MSRVHRAFRIAVISAAVVGIVAAVIRIVIVATMLSIPAERRPELSAYDALALDLLYQMSNMVPGSPDHVRTHDEVVRMSAKYVAHPRFTYTHMVTGILLLVLAPFQFNRELRNRHRRLHRWTGRFILVLVLLSSASAIFFGVLDPGAPALERPSIAIFSAFFLIAATRAFTAIRVRDIARHREWMIRMIAIAVGIGTVRIVSFPVVLLHGGAGDTNLLISMWIGWLLSIGAAEVWIRHTRPASSVTPADAVHA